MKINYNLFIALFGSLFAVSTFASDYHSPRSAALAGAGHAGPLLNDSIFLNPSFTSFLPTYSMGGTFQKFSGSSENSSYKGRTYSLSIQDGRNEMFQAGVAYSLREDGSFVHIGASKAVVKQLGFGLGGKFFFNDVKHKAGNDTTFSTTYVYSDWLQTAFIADNLLESSQAKSREMYREFTLGIKFNVEGIVLLYLDPHLTPNVPNKADGSSQSFGHEVGAEFVVFQDFFLRFGASKNSMVPFEGRRGRAYGFGAGWIAPRISLDYGISRAIEPVVAVAHTFGATIYF